MTSDPRREIGYDAPAPASRPAIAPVPAVMLTVEQLRTLRRIQARSELDRNIWTLLSRDELLRMKLAALTPAGRWIVTPLGVEALERAKGRK
jgi:hypothetical protein